LSWILTGFRRELQLHNKPSANETLALARAGGSQSEQKALGNAHLALDELKRIHQVDRRVA
jgi:hypothetical protein